MFVSMGLLGIVVAIVWYTVYRGGGEAALSPGEAPPLTEGEEEPAPAQHVTLAEWGQLFGFRVTWRLILGFFGVVSNVASNGGKGALRIAYGSRGADWDQV